ncbi:MAG: nitroreductase family protein [Bdellovibrionaceae bacterium]|nr:nitroreductase family protein [Pseudobdellovibrionaceae bacterium]
MNLNSRKTEYPIDSQFIERWSPRAFSNAEIPESTLMAGFEAARWAPSSSNSQPWRYIYSRRNSPTWNQFTSFLYDGNRVWADKSAALIILISKKEFKAGDKVITSGTFAFDTGSAWMSFALQMFKMGWYTHGMAGIHTDKIMADLKIPEGFIVNAMVAVGKPGNIENLPEALQARETPSHRKPLEELVSHGKFDENWIKTE